MNTKQVLAASAVFLSSAVSAAEVCLLANNGFLIKGKNKSVVLDAMIEKPMYGYPALSSETYALFIHGKAPFDSLDVALTTHKHRDHFQAEVLLEHAKNSQTVYVLPPQAKAEIDTIAPDHDLADRLLTDVPIHNSKAIERQVNGVDITIYSINHGAREPAEGAKQTETNHSAYKVEIDGISFTHLGDAKTTTELLSMAGVTKAKTDYLLVPYWSVRNPEYVHALKEAWDFDHLILMHMDQIDRENPKQLTWFNKTILSLKETFPEAWIPLKEMECRKT
ncbi:MBL fold metallo-hydrolase [uncultured Microbulbifer sp.]|uniref:MBL fold metallo-hydrolase n=1 Tax=uncultured Microbulbifer sp. TaxID=348147 RepID=UPI002616E5E5|nr:MBL fold metallo-hydrolase [uncultured Microbulbifer sp.]